MLTAQRIKIKIVRKTYWKISENVKYYVEKGRRGALEINRTLVFFYEIINRKTDGRLI